MEASLRALLENENEYLAPPEGEIERAARTVTTIVAALYESRYDKVNVDNRGVWQGHRKKRALCKGLLVEEYFYTRKYHDGRH